MIHPAITAGQVFQSSNCPQALMLPTDISQLFSVGEQGTGYICDITLPGSEDTCGQKAGVHIGLSNVPTTHSQIEVQESCTIPCGEPSTNGKLRVLD